MDTSPLGKLSPQARKIIYEHLLSFEEPIRISVEEGATPRLEPHSTRKHPLAVTRTCKAIRKKVLPIFYSANVFELHTATFKLPNTRRNSADFDQDDARQAITLAREGTRSRLISVPTLWKWFRQIGFESACHLQHVNFVVGTWDTAHPMHVEPQYVLPKFLAPIKNFFDFTETNCSIFLEVVNENAAFNVLGPHVADLRLPLSNYKKAIEVVNRT